MPILVVQVENADQLLNASYLGAGALGRVERSATGGGAGYSEIGTFALVSGTRSYTYYDLNGAISSWYRIRYSKSDGTSPSSYGDEFQSGDETGGLICSIYDVQERMGQVLSDNDRETMLDIIRDLTTAIEGYCGRWFVPRPLSGTTQYVFDIARTTQRLLIPKGIRSITTLETAGFTTGTYSTLAATDYFLRPVPAELEVGWPFTSISLYGQYFYPGLSTVRITGAYGWSAVPYDIQGIAINAAIRKFIGKERAEPQVFVGPSGLTSFLRDIGPAEVAKLDWYRAIPVG